MAGETKKEDSERETEVSLLDLFIVLLKYKWMILTFALVAAILGFAYGKISFKQNEAKNLHTQGESVFYYSECLIEPDHGMRDNISALLSRINFVLRTVEENHLLNDLQRAILNEKKKDGITTEERSAQETYIWLKQNLFQTTKGDFLAIGLTSKEKDLPAKMINAFLASISEHFRRRDLEIFARQENLLRRQLVVANNSLLKDRIAIEIAGLVDRRTRAESRKYYGFELVDPPSIIERVRVNLKGAERKIEALENVPLPLQTSPTRGGRYTMIIILLILASLMVGVSLAFFLEYIHKMKTQEAEKMALLKRYLSIRRK
jgi:hypothetical protein